MKATRRGFFRMIGAALAVRPLAKQLKPAPEFQVGDRITFEGLYRVRPEFSLPAGYDRAMIDALARLDSRFFISDEDWERVRPYVSLYPSMMCKIEL